MLVLSENARFLRRCSRFLVTAGLCAIAAHASLQPALAQDDGDIDGPVTISRPVVQAIPGGDGLTLNAALARLAQNPRDVSALIDAGNAALKMGDFDAASGFYRRADQVAPGNPRAKAGLAGAMVRSGNPFDAIPLFEQAEKAGATDGALAADRGLAYDLVGDNASAQRYYRLALARGHDDEATRRLALSQAIAGDKRGAEATLTPLLRLQDKAAWRTRAFALAAGGEVDQAITIAKTILPPNLATAIAPYLRYMPRLTRAQQAAAATFGTFPRASEIGQDDPRVALYAPTGPRPALAAADAALTPKGEQLGKRSRTRPAERPARETRPSQTARAAAARSGRVARVAPPEVQPTIETPRAQPAAPAATRVAAASRATPRAATLAPAAAPSAPIARPSGELPPVSATPPPARPATVAAAVPTTTPPPATASSAAPAATMSSSLPPGVLPPAAGVPASSMSAPVVASNNPLPTATAPMPGFDLPVASAAAPAPAVSPPTSVAAVATPPAAAVIPQPAPKVSLADAFREFAGPSRDIGPVAGAVDIRKITPTRPKPPVAEERKPAPPSHPSRIWVQVATGRDKAALAFDWRRMLRQNADVLKGKQAFVSDWGQTNRLLTGPFASAGAANTFLTQLRRAGIDGPFLWTSPAGQVVDALAR